MRHGEALSYGRAYEEMAAVWYVIHTITGFEHELANDLKSMLDGRLCRECMVPVCEDVRRTGGISRIRYRKLFPGYVLIDTDYPTEVFTALGRINNYTSLLGADVIEEDDGDNRDALEKDEDKRAFSAVSKEDMEFLYSILDDGVMRVSYVEGVNGNKAKRIIGPLAKYGNHISRIKFRERWAVVEAEIFGKKRKIRFGLWTDEDPKIPWIEEKRAGNDKVEYLLDDAEIGLHVGDKVIDITGTYGDMVFEVDSVNPTKGIFTTKVLMLGELREMKMFIDNVEVIEGR